MTHTYSKVLFHLVWSTKNRQPFIEHHLKIPLYKYIKGIIEKKESKLYIINGIPDHIHLLLGFPLTMTVSELVQQIKVSSTRWIRKENLHHPYLKQFSWQEGFGAFTVGASTLEQVKNYIANQEKHHRRVSFEEEYLGFLQKLEIPYDNYFVLG